MSNLVRDGIDRALLLLVILCLIALSAVCVAEYLNFRLGVMRLEESVTRMKADTDARNRIKDMSLTNSTAAGD